ncbi:hypothetical protein YC2023_009681 [Brassica napus]
MNRVSFDRQSIRELETTKNNTQKDPEFIVSRFLGFPSHWTKRAKQIQRLSGVLLPMAFYMGVEGRLRVVIS